MKYLEGIGSAPPLSSRAVTTLRKMPGFLLVIGLTFSALAWPGPIAARIFAGAAIAVALAWVARIYRRSNTTRSARFARAVLAEQHEEIVAEARRVLGGRETATARSGAFAQLGRCAELCGDFADSAELYGLARRELLLAGGGHGVLTAPALAAREAFVHAAADQFDECERVLAFASGSGAPPETAGLVLRARALAFARSGKTQELRELLEAEVDEIDASMDARDRALFAAMEAHVGLKPRPQMDDDIATFVARVLPAELAP